MTSPLIGTPLIRITYLRANEVRGIVSTLPGLERYNDGVFIHDADVRTLRLVADRNFIVKLVCPGQRTYQGRVKAMLKRLIRVPATQLWYLPTTMTGPLRQSPPGT
jgi:hypothetical protein